MSLYADYIKERESLEIVESDRGFATFSVTGHECYLRDIYVVPELRQSGEASLMAKQVEQIAKERGCTVITGTVCPTAKGSTASVKVLLAYGFQLLRSEPNFIIFVKEIE